MLHFAGRVLILSSEGVAAVPFARCVRIWGELVGGKYGEAGGVGGLSRGAGAGGQGVDGAEEIPQWLNETMLGEP